MLKNLEIRKAIEKKRLRHYEVAEALKINYATFSHLLAKELPECEGKWNKKMILEVIETIE